MAFISCKKVPLVEVTPANRPPVANAGPDQTIILPVNSVTLDGSASTDPDGTITSYGEKNINYECSDRAHKADRKKNFISHKNLLNSWYRLFFR